MIADIAARIAGAHAAVESLMGPGTDPHLYKPSEGDVGRLSRADLILYNGLGLEGRMGDLFAQLAGRRSVVAVAEVVPASKWRVPPEFDGKPDPHVWFDVGLWALTIDPIAEALAKLAPQHAADFSLNAARLRDELAALDQEAAAALAALPPSQRVLVTAHDAFGYFGRRYGFEVVGLQGISTVSEPGIEDVQKVADLIVERQIKAIFVETSVPPRRIEAVLEAVRARGHEVRIGGQLFSDAMGAAGTPEGTYAGMVRWNVRTIVESLR
jgi:manganese/zinc/iron transport system substrate-binding protein